MRVSGSVAFILRFILLEVSGEGRMMEVQVRGTDLGTAFKADAKAEGATVRIGGWGCLGGTPASRSR